jgi:hypothetical protein
MMSYRSLAMLLICTALFADAASAAVTAVRATPRQASLVGSGSNLVSISWQVSTTPDHLSGVASATAAIIDPASGAVLQAFRTPLDATGSGPFVLREIISLDAATVSSWTDQGLRRVVLERSFVDPATGSSVNATAVLTLSQSRLRAARDAAPAELSIVALRLEFESGNNTAIATIGEPLRAMLTVQYTGSGMLAGRWQIAEPESSEGTPLFRTMALVNTNLQASQRSTLRSPVLPTARGGKYLVRFCATSRTPVGAVDDTQCPDADLVATATYHVQSRGDGGVGLIERLSPDRQIVSERSPFGWRPVAGAVVYQLQIFELAPAAVHSILNEARDNVEPRFVAGMLLDGGTSSTPLSELARSKLQAGQRYLWRVTAYDDAGRTIGSSAESSFVYRPDD